MAVALRYTTVANIRQKSGLKDSDLILDADIEAIIRRAEAEIDSVLLHIYTLPLSENDTWVDSPAEKFIESIATDLASGLAMVDQYGEEAEGTNKDGWALVDSVRGRRPSADRRGIAGIFGQVRNRYLKLIGSDSTELAVSSVGTIGGHPDDTTEDAEDEDGGGDVKFRMSDKY